MISEKLMMAVLALDAYSRTNDDPELENDVTLYNMDDLGLSLGGATVVEVQNVPGSSFVAVNYSWNGKTVLAFRGTDNPFHDAFTGWTIGAGFDQASQAKLAQEFYTSQTGLELFGEASSNVILTGHSLGGGLAGYLSALNGTKAYGFDHMTFGPAAEATIVSHLHALALTDPSAAEFAAAELRLPDASQFIGTHVEGEVLEGVRNGTYAMAGAAIAGMYSLLPANFLTSYAMGATWLLANMSAAQAAYEDNVANSVLPTFGWGDNYASEIPSFARHSQSLLVLLQFAVDEPVGGQWISSGFSVPLINALYKDGVAISAGIKQGPATDLTASGRSNPADLMLTKIAYTVLDSGNRPFGDSAIRSLLNDADAVGAFLNDGSNTMLDVSGVADDIARFAAFQAHHAVIGQHDGFVSLNGNLLTLDYQQQTWTFGGTPGLLSGVGRDFSNYLDDQSLSPIERVNLDMGPGRFEYEYYSNAAGGWHGQIAHEAGQFYAVKAVGTDTIDTIIGTNGDEQILLGGGNDQVKANGGVNWIDGGADIDTLIDDNAWADFEITLQNGRYYFALRESGIDPYIHVLDNMELFRLAGEDFDAANVLNVAPTDVFISSFVGDANGDGFLPGSVTAGTEIANLCAVDGNEHDRFTWEILGTGANFYTIENGVLKASVDLWYTYSYWYAQVGVVTFEDWQAGDLTNGFAGLLGTEYGFTVRATDAAGMSFEKDVFLFLENPDQVLVGTPQVDILAGGAGRTIIAGLAGADQISDSDWLVLDYSASNAGVRIVRSSTTDLVMEGYGGHAQGDVTTLGSTSTKYEFIGSAHKDEVFYAWKAYTGAGDDIITGSKFVFAGDGYDTVNVTNNTDYVDFGAGGGELNLANGQGYFVDIAQGIYHRMSGGAVAHALTVIGDYTKITGSNQNDTIYGTAGNDRIYGGGGSFDDLRGGDGDDYIEGTGNLEGNVGIDTIVLTGAGGAWGGTGDDILSTSVQWTTLLGGADNDRLTSHTNYVWLVGGAGADSIIGSNASKVNTVSYEYAPVGVGVTYNGANGAGWAGEADGDVLQGNFSFIGSIWADQFNVTLNRQAAVRGGAGNDIIYAVLGNYTTVYGDGMTFVADTDDDDEIYTTGSGGTVFGGRGNDIISGVGTLYGDDGEDRITSAAGDHSIYLGVDTDIDTFVFSRLAGFDRIHDFTSIDVIEIGSGYKYDDFGDILDNAYQVDGNVDIWFESNAKLTLVNYQKSLLTASNFDFT